MSRDTMIRLPSFAHEVEAGLASIFQDDVGLLEYSTIKSGTHAKGRVRIRSGHGEAILFLKHGLADDACPQEPRRGVLHEEMIYRTVLPIVADLVEPIYLGSFRTSKPNHIWLVLRYLPESLRLNQVDVGDAVVEAADLLGRVHSRFDVAAGGLAVDLLQYSEHLLRSAQRGIPNSPQSVELRRWLRDGAKLLSQKVTLVHGEYVAKNILVSGGRTVPVDWESSGLGAGEIDLAMLCYGWPQELFRRATERYIFARWGGSIPGDFEARLSMARLYVRLRWPSLEQA